MVIGIGAQSCYFYKNLAVPQKYAIYPKVDGVL